MSLRVISNSESCSPGERLSESFTIRRIVLRDYRKTITSLICLTYQLSQVTIYAKLRIFQLNFSLFNRDCLIDAWQMWGPWIVFPWRRIEIGPGFIGSCLPRVTLFLGYHEFVSCNSPAEMSGFLLQPNARRKIKGFSWLPTSDPYGVKCNVDLPVRIQGKTGQLP